MKITAVILTLSLLTIFSCKKEKQLSIGEFSCQVNGVQWRGTDPSIDISQENRIEFAAEDTSYRFLIQLQNNGEATYDLTSTENKGAVIDLANEGFVQYHTHSDGGENTGSITISSIIIDDLKKTMNGEFHFEAFKLGGESLVITNGIFKDVPYQE